MVCLKKLLVLVLVLPFVLTHPFPSLGQAGKVMIHDKQGKERCRLHVDYAVTPSEQSRGLMFRKRLEENRGMLFVFEGDEIRQFWMRNTLIPLDIIFIDSLFVVVDVHRGAKPLDETVIESHLPARYVLEVNAGKAGKCSISPGTTVRFTDLPK